MKESPAAAAEDLTRGTWTRVDGTSSTATGERGIGILVVDDSRLYREATRDLLREQSWVERSETAGESAGAMAGEVAFPPTITLLNMSREPVPEAVYVHPWPGCAEPPAPAGCPPDEERRPVQRR